MLARPPMLCCACSPESPCPRRLEPRAVERVPHTSTTTKPETAIIVITSPGKGTARTSASTGRFSSPAPCTPCPTDPNRKPPPLSAAATSPRSRTSRTPPPAPAPPCSGSRTPSRRAGCGRRRRSVCLTAPAAWRGRWPCRSSPRGARGRRAGGGGRGAAVLRRRPWRRRWRRLARPPCLRITAKDASSSAGGKRCVWRSSVQRACCATFKEALAQSAVFDDPVRTAEKQGHQHDARPPRVAHASISFKIDSDDRFSWIHCLWTDQSRVKSRSTRRREANIYQMHAFGFAVVSIDRDTHVPSRFCCHANPRQPLTTMPATAR